MSQMSSPQAAAHSVTMLTNSLMKLTASAQWLNARFTIGLDMPNHAVPCDGAGGIIGLAQEPQDEGVEAVFSGYGRL